jgi:hypothetical protein
VGLGTLSFSGLTAKNGDCYRLKGVRLAGGFIFFTFFTAALEIDKGPG